MALMQISEPLFEGGHLGLLIVIWTVLTRLHTDEERPEAVADASPPDNRSD